MPSRRHFLRGRFSEIAQVLRPPWAGHEADFVATCQRCDACVRVCPAGILRTGAAGFPEVDFHLGTGECSFCGECVAACPSGALNRQAKQEGHKPWQAEARIADTCLTHQQVLCRACGEACPSNAIRFAPARVASPQVTSELCTACGACVAVCPSRAITVQPVASSHAH